MQQLSTEPDERSAQELKTLTMPFGIRLVAMYSILTVIGIGPAWLAPFLGEPTMVDILAGSVVALFVILLIAIVYGLLKLKQWGHKLAKVVYSIAIVFGAIALIPDLAIENVIQQGISIAIAIWIIIYLRKEHIKALFVR